MIAALAMTAAAAATNCTPPIGWDSVEHRHTRYVIFGEYHGTAEAPAFVARIACALARRGERLLVAIEQQWEDDAALRRIWRLPRRRFASALARLPLWAGRDDGVGSRAMFAMLIRLHGLGRKVRVVAFNPTQTQEARFSALPLQGPHEAAQADNIRAVADRGDYRRVLVLTGNLHARTLPVMRQGVSFEPMAMHLAPRREVISLDMRSSGGTAWACQMTGAVTPGAPIDAARVSCKAQTVLGDPAVGGTRRIALRPVADAAALDPSYDGFYYVGQVTASPPQDAGR